MEKLMGFKLKINNKESHNRIWYWTFGDGDIDNPVIDLAGLFNIQNEYPLTSNDLEEEQMIRLEQITKLKGIRCIYSYPEKWNEETNEAECVFATYNKYPEEIMKFISKEHQNQTLKVVRFCEYYDEKWILEEKVEFWKNGKRK